MKKRILSLVLVVAMVATLFAGLTLTASAAEGYYLATSVPAVGDKIVIAFKSGDDYYALPNANKSSGASIAGTKITVTDGCAAATSAVTFEVISKDNQIGIKSTEDANYLGFNSDKISMNGWGNTKYATIAAASDGMFTISSSNNAPRGLSYSGTNFTVANSGASPVYIFVLGEGGTTPPASEETTAPSSEDPTPSSEEPAPSGDGKYVKVTSAPADGQYLIVCEDQNVAFNGGLTTLDAVSNTVAVSPANGEIAASAALAAAEFTFTASNGSFLGKGGKYFGFANNENGLTSSTTALSNTVTITNGDADIVSAGGSYLRYNATSGQTRFRFYKSSTYTNQKAIQLYVWVAGEPTEPETPCDHETYEDRAAVAATCTTSGFEAGRYCLDCDTYISGGDPIAALGHDYAVVHTTAPSCTEAGLDTYTCSRCSDSYTREVAALGHNYVDGSCSVCGEPEPDFGSYVKITAAPETWAGDYIIVYETGEGGAKVFNGVDEAHDYVAATIVDDTIAGADGMAVITIADEGEDGLTLKIGDNYLYNNKSSNGIGTDSTEKYNTITFGNDGEALITYNEKVIRFNATAGDNNDRFRYYTAGSQQPVYLYKLAGDTPDDPPVEEPHESAWLAGQAADCTNDGFIGYYYCVECLDSGEHFGKCYSDAAMTEEIADITIAALGHNIVTDAAVPATCTTTGLTAGEHCSRCDYVVAQETAPALGHNYVLAQEGDDGYLAPTCTDTGLQYEVCSRCGELGEGTELPALGHDWAWDGDVGEEGYHGVYCQREGCVANDLVECTMVDGTCSVCGYTEVVVDPYLDESLTFLQAAMCIESYIGADFIVKNTTIDGYTNTFVRLEYPTVDGTATEDLPLLVYSSKYKFVEHQVAAKEMSDVISATLYGTKNGVEYHGPTLDWSVASGSRAGMDKASATAADKAFYVALLNYGAKAQIFFEYNQDNLATSVLTAEEIADYLPAARNAVNAEATTSTGKTGVTFYRMAFSCGPVTVLNVIFKLGTGTVATDVECHISYIDRTGVAKTEVIDEFTKSGSSYVVLFDKLTAKQLGSNIEITFYSKTTGQAISETKTYSEESYIYANPYTGTARGDMFTALIQYADAAAVKFA